MTSALRTAVLVASTAAALTAATGTASASTAVGPTTISAQPSGGVALLLPAVQAAREAARR